MEHLGVSWEQNLLAIEETESISQWLNHCALSNELDGNSCSWMASDALFADLLHSYHDGFFESSRTGSGFFSPNSMSDARQDAMAQFLYEKQIATAPVQLITGDLKFESSVDEKPLEIEIDDGLFQSPKKKARVSSMPRSAKKAGNDGAIDGQSTSSHSSENWSNATPRMNSKTRATDPQSLYARKRRERINERLRTLQSLVPNGTKVDISTMLEEAVQYVKFLQLQIQLLSSDELWMYAPIAYNGMLDLQMLQRKQ